MNSPSAPPLSRSNDPGRLGARQMTLWAAFTGLLVLGFVLYFRFADHIVPLLDAMTDR